MTLNTFSAGVNTGFSSQLNNNFSLLKQYSTMDMPLVQEIIYANGSSYTPVVITSVEASATTVNVVGADSGTGKIFKTTNSGSSWTEKTSGLGSAIALYTAIGNSNYILAIGGSGTKYTTDGGENWSTFTAPSGFTSVTYAITDEGRVYAVGKLTATNVISIVYTDNGGSSYASSIRTGAITWSTADPGKSLTVPKNGYIVYAASHATPADYEIYYSTDNGGAWTGANAASGAANGTFTSGYYINSSNYALYGTVAPASGDTFFQQQTVVVGGSSSLYSSNTDTLSSGTNRTFFSFCSGAIITCEEIRLSSEVYGFHMRNYLGGLWLNGASSFRNTASGLAGRLPTMWYKTSNSKPLIYLGEVDSSPDATGIAQASTAKAYTIYDPEDLL
jgi:photosystem II stability/assembly factor-like uncharacterized protein